MADGSDGIGREKFRVERMSGHVRITWADNCEVAEMDAIEAIDSIRTVGGGTAYPLLVDARTMRSIDRRGRALFATSDVVSSVALLVQSALSRTVGGFFLGLSRPVTPMRMFTDEAAAIAWLAGAHG